MSKFQPPPRQPGESNHAYAARKSSALGRHNIEQAKDKRRLTGADRTPAQKRGDLTRGNTTWGQPRPHRKEHSNKGTAGTHADPTLERTTKHYQMGPCSKCDSSGRQKVGIINQRFVTCRKCGGRGETWEKR